ncbi:MerR family transcriptional regulator [Chitinophaga nivalis]|uniref:MerR family transcriptional regulator n=1 Tax=Chitinophaga nivalis TaxID=2991709 RepID=A0ABT3IRC6_9BACT|nr:MerR family transcriptional regulator [Chitinophaga nivalis]MCW3463774.1 MerR family transcriptional regulator [Chitinophaga nivalis]MCW3486536.1 MerR family transcriptional regulator [Chitinophaga nivalis]
MDNYSVKKLSQLAGVSVRTLHLYDKIDLLKPAVRTGAGYRLYGEKELLRLQQILFYRELDFPLKDICTILDDPAFDLMQALEGHKVALLARQERIHTLIGTIEKTLVTLKNNTMLQVADLYEGLPQEKVAACRTAAISQWGTDTILGVEDTLRSLGKEEITTMQTALNDITSQLTALVGDPANAVVQACIARRYEIITRLTGGKTEPGKLAYFRKLGELYADGKEHVTADGLPNQQVAIFIKEATDYYLKNKQH